MMSTNNQELFYKLVRAGLWADADGNLSLKDRSAMPLPLGSSKNQNDKADWEKIYQLAEEQSVIGVVLAGIERLKNANLHLDQELLLQWIGEVQMLEQQNKAMNQFIAELIERLRKADIYTLLLKGQGIAQCYERPLWRSCGDVDLLLSDSNYDKAKSFLTPLADHVEPESKEVKHLGMTIGEWIVELHGTMHTSISKRVNKGIDKVQEGCFYGGNVRSWMNGKTPVFLPAPDNDVIFVFTHILEHFFIEGVGLRQICDWCRLLYTYKDTLDYGLLESRVRKMGLMSEWKAFASLAVDTLGMPVEAMPFYDARFKDKGEKVLRRVLKNGNFGHNNDLSYRSRYSGMTYKFVAAWRRLKDFASLIPVFPLDAPRFYVTYVMGKVK